MGRRDPGHRVGRAGAGGDEHHPGPAGDPRIAVLHVGRALLVAYEDVLDVVLLVEGVVDVQDRPARISEDVTNPRGP